MVAFKYMQGIALHIFIYNNQSVVIVDLFVTT